MKKYEELMIKVRRDMHKYPEGSWCEFRTTEYIKNFLKEQGWKTLTGREVNNFKAIHRPSAEAMEPYARAAADWGVDSEFVNRMVEEGTGVVGILDTGRPGPTLAFRFDIDALAISESQDENHLPKREGFVSLNDGFMHACGHDGHIAIGLGLVKYLSDNAEKLNGKIKMIFQPAEEIVSGALAMADAGVLEDVDYFLSGHIGLGADRLGDVYCGCEEFLALNRIDVSFKGRAAHAGLAPERGRNAILAAAHAIVNLHTLPTRVRGSKLNVGVIRGGLARNIIAPYAELELETRGDTNEANDEITGHVFEVLKSIAHIYGVEYEYRMVGHAGCAVSDPELMDIIQELAEQTDGVDRVMPLGKFKASEDATVMMEKVQKNGGKASYLLIGTNLKGNHHEPNFDFAEDTLGIALSAFSKLAIKLIGA